MPADSTSATTPRTSFQSLLRQRGSWVTAKRTFSPASTDNRSSVSFWVSTPVVSSRAARKPLEISNKMCIRDSVHTGVGQFIQLAVEAQGQEVVTGGI